MPAVTTESYILLQNAMEQTCYTFMNLYTGTCTLLLSRSNLQLELLLNKLIRGVSQFQQYLIMYKSAYLSSLPKLSEDAVVQSFTQIM